MGESESECDFHFNSSKDKDKDIVEEEIVDLDVNEMESWNHKMCKHWIAQNIDHQLDEMNGNDLIKMLNALRHQNGSFEERKKLESECDRLSNVLQSTQLEMDKLNGNYNKLEKKLKSP